MQTCNIRHARGLCSATHVVFISCTTGYSLYYLFCNRLCGGSWTIWSIIVASPVLACLRVGVYLGPRYLYMVAPEIIRIDLITHKCYRIAWCMVLQQSFLKVILSVLSEYKSYRLDCDILRATQWRSFDVHCRKILRSWTTYLPPIPTLFRACRSSWLSAWVTCKLLIRK